MKLLTIALLLASVASVRSANTIEVILLHGFSMTDPTGNAATVVGPAAFDLLVEADFAPFVRQVKVTDATGSAAHSAMHILSAHRLYPSETRDIEVGSSGTTRLAVVYYERRSCDRCLQSRIGSTRNRYGPAYETIQNEVLLRLKTPRESDLEQSIRHIYKYLPYQL
ncbi:uncharacterized protein MKK02DRAFT_27992 [Dioszegia hungarica]|uniref:Uncharacterized protein n=1 Tax=Dioszegia hungarica TaxID=4972 RepID=A0AA38LV47_9TREE|nr:uncharacterized protein MKK02DRAFT_27992 [Dioszegia hungarica]KAI9634861.1 hypothetical protein MKK02DRAFT_27992 [Dioszegia hungarica]